MGYFDDTSGLYGDSTNNAAADFTRLNASNPGQFSNSIFDRLFGGRNKKEVQQEALAASASPEPAPTSPTPDLPTPKTAPKIAPDLTDPVHNSSLSSGSGLVRRILGQVMGPPTANEKGEPLVPGTPFTTQQLMEKFAQLLPDAAAGAGTAPYQGIPQFNGPQPPMRQVQSPFGNQTHGGQQFGGGRFGGQQFGASAPMQAPPMQVPPPPPPSPMAGAAAGPAANGMGMGIPVMQNQSGAGGLPMPPPGYSPMQSPTDRLRALGANQSSPVGYFRGGSLEMMRGGYPADLMMGMPTRHFATGGPDGNYVHGDGHGDGRSDHVDAKLSPGEFVQDAETVSLLGNGDSDAGARGMEAIRQTIRKEKGKALAQGKFSPNAKKPGFYAGVGMRAAKGKA